MARRAEGKHFVSLEWKVENTLVRPNICFLSPVVSSLMDIAFLFFTTQSKRRSKSGAERKERKGRETQHPSKVREVGGV